MFAGARNLLSLLVLPDVWVNAGSAHCRPGPDIALQWGQAGVIPNQAVIVAQDSPLR